VSEARSRLSLTPVLQLEVIQAFSPRATGAKVLINPGLP
jgi:hypothetical protein